MSQPLRVRQLSHALQQKLVGLLDLSDPHVFGAKPDEPRVLTRALAAVTVWDQVGCSLEEAAASVVDGGKDGGIDAIYAQQQPPRLYLVQSKWRNPGNATLNADAVNSLATPRDEIDRNTYSRFELDDGDPTDVFDLDEAVHLGYLVPPRGVDVPLVFPRLGKRYAELTEEEREQWDALEWDSEGNIPDVVNAEEVNRYLFNRQTVDEALKALMVNGIKVGGGDRRGKTIVFARNEKHANFIVERFNANYPEYRGEFARVITSKSDYAEQLIDYFSEPDKAPHIAVSVDMLDTGIDIPEVVNLLLFKPVRSKTKYWQMIGRGTRLRPNLFGPDDEGVPGLRRVREPGLLRAEPAEPGGPRHAPVGRAGVPTSGRARPHPRRAVSRCGRRVWRRP
jgi:hypothetical protein